MNEIQFDKILKEHFDTTDRKSMRTLLSLNEVDQNQAMAALASKLYQKIIDKVDDIDYGTIPASKGDITKIGNFQEMRDCINTINDILVHYKQDTVHLDTIDKAIENLKSSKKIWEKAYAVDCDFAIVFYNTISLSIVSALSLLISASIDFIKEPGNKSFQISFDKVGYNKTKDRLLFKNLENFNKSYAKGDIEKLMGELVKANVKVRESAMQPLSESIIAASAIGLIVAGISGGVLVATLLMAIIPILHELTSALYCARQKVSEYFELQAKVVQFNAENLKYDYTKSEEEIKKIYNKQIKIAESFKKISNKFAVKMSKAESDAKRQIEKERAEKLKAEELETEDVPRMVSSIF